MIRSKHSHFFFFRVSDGRYRRTNYRVIVKNLSSRTSWQVLFTLCTFIVSEYTYCHNSSVQNIVTIIVTNIVTIRLCRISLHTFPTARCCLDVPWPVVHVCPLGSWPSLSWGPFRVFLAPSRRLVQKIDQSSQKLFPHHLVVSIWPPWLAPETWRWARKLKITLRQKGYLWKVCTSRILYFIFRKSLTKVALSSYRKSYYM